MSMMKQHNFKLQTNLWHSKDERQNIYINKTSDMVDSLS